MGARNVLPPHLALLVLQVMELSGLRKRRRLDDDDDGSRGEWLEPAPKQEKEEDLDHSSDDDFSPGQLVIDTADSDVSPGGSKNSK